MSLHAIAQTQLRKHVASMAWGARYLISTQVWSPPPRERGKDPFGRGKGGDRVWGRVESNLHAVGAML